MDAEKWRSIETDVRS